MKREIEIKESIYMKKQRIETKKNIDGAVLNDGVIHDLKIQVDALEWVLKD